MSISYPVSLDNITKPSASSPQNSPSHSGLHGDEIDAIHALQAKVGITNSAETSSHDYRIAQLEASSAYTPFGEAPSGAVNGVNTTFTLTNAPSPAAGLMLFLNGVYQTAGGVDYTLSGSTITYVTAPVEGSLFAHYFY